MEKLFFSDPWYASRRPHCHGSTSQPTSSRKPKVISIPVTDRSKTPITVSNKLDRPSAAVKIQKAVRGFLVRRTMRDLRKIAAEAEEIGHQISPEKVCSNAKERLRIAEMLMALLLRLDAVRGVRDYRKKVIRRVIQLQEAVDSTQPGSALTDTATTTETTEQEEEEAIQQEDGRIEDVTNVATDIPVDSEEFEEEAQQIEDMMIEEALEGSDEIVAKEMEQECDEMMKGAPRKTELSSAEGMTGMKEMMEKLRWRTKL